MYIYIYSSSVLWCLPSPSRRRSVQAHLGPLGHLQECEAVIREMPRAALNHGKKWRKVAMVKPGVGIDVPFFKGFVEHHQSPNICWRWNIPFVVGWCETLGHLPTPVKPVEIVQNQAWHLFKSRKKSTSPDWGTFRIGQCDELKLFVLHILVDY